MNLLHDHVFDTVYIFNMYRMVTLEQKEQKGDFVTRYCN